MEESADRVPFTPLGDVLLDLSQNPVITSWVMLSVLNTCWSDSPRQPLNRLDHGWTELIRLSIKGFTNASTGNPKPNVASVIGHGTLIARKLGIDLRRGGEGRTLIKPRRSVREMKIATVSDEPESTPARVTASIVSSKDDRTPSVRFGWWDFASMVAG